MQHLFLPDVVPGQRKLSVSTSGSKGVQPSMLMACWTLLSLSVSTSGSKGVQLSDSASIRTGKSPFSIHKRIEGGATKSHKAMSSRLIRFQYPQADRRGCNLQQCPCYCHCRCPFSIHKRIEGGATDQSGYFVQVANIFQYPQADRRGCNQGG